MPASAWFVTATLLLACALSGAWAWTLRRRLGALAGEAGRGRVERERLRARLGAERAERRELEAALRSMSDAVLAVGSGGRVLRINRAAGRLLSCDPAAARGLPLEEVARDAAVRRLFAAALAGEDAGDGDLRLAVADQPLDRPRHLSARTAVLRDAGGAAIGALAVLRDVTELRRLEGVRREFVANVSHELKTPIAAIKAAVETLVDPDAPAAAQRVDPEAAARFLPMVARHADRLDAIIEDLLALARLEDPAARPELTVDWVAPVLAAAADACRPAAAEAGVELELQAQPGLLARMQPNLVEQAVTNLIENAVKYAAAGGWVGVDAEADGPRVLVRVRDRGPGIDARHLPRLFERFYRADASRTRPPGNPGNPGSPASPGAAGGTGLGLSIVRHVAEACGGSVAVASEVGEGTVFTLTLRGPGGVGQEAGEGERAERQSYKEAEEERVGCDDREQSL